MLQTKLLHLFFIERLLWSLAGDSYHQIWQVGTVQGSLQNSCFQGSSIQSFSSQFIGHPNQHACQDDEWHEFTGQNVTDTERKLQNLDALAGDQYTETQQQLDADLFILESSI